MILPRLQPVKYCHRTGMLTTSSWAHLTEPLARREIPVPLARLARRGTRAIRGQEIQAQLVPQETREILV